MQFPLRYAPRGYETLARLRRLYVDREPGLVLAAMKVPGPALATFGRARPAGLCDYPDPHERARFWDEHLGEHGAIEDDAIPCAYLSEMDQGLYGGLLDGRVAFQCDPGNGWISSMCEPLLSDWSQFPRLKFDPGHAWFQRYVTQLEIFVQAARGKFGISHFILVDSLNFVFELLGATKTYLALIDQPQRIREAIAFAFDLNLRVQQAFFEKVELVEGGTCSNMAQWIPGRIISDSVDPFHMMSADYFETWGRAPLEGIFARFEGGVLHIHGNGRHLFEAMATVKGLKALWLGDDRGFPPAFSILDSIRRRVGDLPLVVAVPYAEFGRALNEHRLTGGVFYCVTQVPDAATANRCMERVRAYRA